MLNMNIILPQNKSSWYYNRYNWLLCVFDIDLWLQGQNGYSKTFVAGNHCTKYDLASSNMKEEFAWDH